MDEETYDFPDTEGSSGFEGGEYIIMLGPSRNPTVEAWETVGYEYSLWNITREEDGLRAKSTAFHLADTLQQSQAMNRPLNEVIQEIKTAVEARIAVNEGRIGPDAGLPMIVTDANRLQDYYIAVGRVYEGEGANIVLPPPAAPTTTQPTAEETTTTTQLHTQDTTPTSTETAQPP